MRFDLKFKLLMMLLLALAVPAGLSAQAEDIKVNATMTYEVTKSGKTIVTENYTLANPGGTHAVPTLTVHAPSADVTAISARNGTKTVETTTETATRQVGDLAYEYTAIKLDIGQQFKQAGQTYKVSLTYTAGGLVETHGRGRAVFIPGIASGHAGTSYTAEVKVPLDFGTAPLGADLADRSGILANQQFFNFSADKLAGDSVALWFGEPTVYRANLKLPLKNNWPWPRTVEATLPPELASQRVFFAGADPAPLSTRLDSEGNIIAGWRLGPWQKLEVNTDVLVEVKSLVYDLKQPEGFDAIPAELAERYTAATSPWPTGGAVAEAAAGLIDREEPVAAAVEQIYNFVVEKLSYQNTQLDFGAHRGAEAALNAPGQAVASDYSDLLTAMLRSQGIPARTIIGSATSRGLKLSVETADSLHTWVEAYVPGVGWMTLDPVWGEKFDHFGTHTVDHIGLIAWGGGAVPEPSPSANYQYEAAEFTVAEETLPELSLADVGVSATRYVLLPFISLERVTATGPAGFSADNFVAQVDGHNVLIGSLAPGERKTLNRFILGSSWNRTADITLTQLVSDGVAGELASGRVGVTYLPLIVLLVLIVVLIASAVWWRRHRRQKLLHTPRKGHAIEKVDMIGDHVGPTGPEAPGEATPAVAEEGEPEPAPYAEPETPPPVQPPNEPVSPPATKPASSQPRAADIVHPTRPRAEQPPPAQPADDKHQVHEERIRKLIEDHPHSGQHRPGDIHPPGSSQSE